MPDIHTTVTTVGRTGRGRVFDPGDPRHGGLPAWSQGSVPRHLLTRRELATLGLRPGGQPVCGRLVWRGRDGVTRCALLYDLGQARLTRRPVRRHRAAKRQT